MAERVISVKLLDDFTMCPICHEIFNDPRSLPCLHTFCLTCISKWNKDKLPGEIVDCPFCRKQFTISPNGLQDLPKNTFIGKLLAMTDVSSSAPGAPLCDSCATDPTVPVDKKKRSIQRCAKCEEGLCEDCIDSHSKQECCSSNRTHYNGEEVLCAKTASRCDKHPKEELVLFCLDCKEALCQTCSASKHSKHRSAKIEAVAEEIRRDIKRNISQLKGGVDCLADLLSTFRTKRLDVISQSNRVEAEILSRAEHLKSTVERHKQQLISELIQFRSEKLKEVDVMINDTAQNKTLIESLIEDSEQRVEKGSSGDIAKHINSWNKRVADMKQFYMSENVKTAQTLRDTIVIFVPSETTVNTINNAIGKLELTEGNGSLVDAVTSYNHQLFVTRYATKQVEIYDSSTLKLERLIKLPDSVGAYREGLAVCSVNDCLYVSDNDNNDVYKVNLSASDSDTATRWPVARGPLGLSVNKCNNLLVACTKIVQEYTSTAMLVREVKIEDGVRHALELNDGTLVVSQSKGKVKNCVSIVSLDGKVLRSYPSTTATVSRPEQMNCPHSLAVDRNGFILVADYYNDRILVLNAELTDARTLPLTLDTPLQKPRGLCFEESRGQLYVGEQGGEKRVLVFDNVYNVHALFT